MIYPVKDPDVLDALLQGEYTRTASITRATVVFRFTSAPEDSPGSSTRGSERHFHASTFPPREERQLLCGFAQTDLSDALRLWGYQSFGARLAAHSRVEWFARVLPAGAPPHLPNTAGTGHTRGWVLLDPDRRLKRPSRGRAALAQCHRRTDASAARAVS
jgi:hypothetical protein